MSRAIRWLTVLILPVLVGFTVYSSAPAPGLAAAQLPPTPTRWPATLQLGMADGPGGAAGLKTTAAFGFRYQYLAGGVNTGAGWSTWNPDGQFVTNYIQDSVANGITPVLTYYMMFQSNPGVSQGEAAGVSTNLQNTQTMTAYFNDLKLFFQRAGASQSTVVLHMEPDLWGFVQSRVGDNASAQAARVSSTGLSELVGLPEDMRGFAQAVVRLRDRYAPNVLVAYHLSTWGSGEDPALSNASDSQIDQLAARSANFYRSLQANFDLSFGEFSDRDAGFKQQIYGDGGSSWWDAADFTRNVRYIQGFVTASQKRMVMWQIPLGNTKMRAMNNTWNHYQDNRVEWLLDEPARSHMLAYAQAGVVAFLFGRGADGATCACDAAGDGVTNPSPINGNSTSSVSADDDGGFFRQKAAAYYAAGPLNLPSSTTIPPTPTTVPATPTRTPVPATNTPRPATATPVPTGTPPSQATWTATANVSPASVNRGGTENITATVRATRASTALVDIEVYGPTGSKVDQRFFDNQTFSADSPRTFSMSWTAPANATRGTYTVRVGVFSPGWGQLFSWTNSAATFQVR